MDDDGHAATVLLSVGWEDTVTIQLDCPGCGRSEMQIARRHLALLAQLVSAAVERDAPTRSPMRMRESRGSDELRWRDES